MLDHKSKNKKDRIWTGAVIIISMMGILFFGYKAIRENSLRNQENPFEYNIERFKENDASLVKYSEVNQMPIEVPHVYGLAVGPEENRYGSGDNAMLIFSGDGTQQC